MNYSIGVPIGIKLKRDEDGAWVATAPGFPGVVEQGETPSGAVRNMDKALRFHIKCMQKEAMRPDDPRKDDGDG